MNSRIENGKTAWENREEIENELQHIYNTTDEIDYIVLKENQIEYTVNDDIHSNKVLVFDDTPEAFFERVVFDEKVRDYLNPDKVADFIYNCIDINAVSCVKAIAFIYNEPVYDDKGEIEGYKVTNARKELMTLLDTEDEYAYEVGIDGEPLLGICWVERSAVIINVDAIVKAAKEDYYDYGEDFFESFENALLLTICHEFRHAVYEFNEFTALGTKEYPRDGGIERNVEDYGNAEAMRILHNTDAFPYVDAIYSDNLKTMEKQSESIEII